MDDLKRCPFCGGDPRMIYDLEGAPTGVMCRECGAVVHFIGIQPVKRRETFERFINEITERWNKTAERG